MTRFLQSGFFIALAIIQIQAYAAAPRVWTKVEGGASQIDRRSIELRPDGYIQAWQKDWLLPGVRSKLEVDLRKIGTIVDYSDYGYSITLWLFDCKNKRVAVSAGADYSLTGEVINSFDVNSPEFSSIIPDSAAEASAQYVCTYKTSRR
jgi:hypothetical protein